MALLAPAAASAHARLEGTTPPQGAVTRHEPAAVIFEFDEPVEGSLGAVRVYDSAGERVDQGTTFHPHGEGPKLAVHLRPDLPDGSYTATYRVVSADGHVVAGGYVFSVGAPGKAPTETVGELISGGGSGTVTEIAYGLARVLEYVAIALAVGGVAFLLICRLPALAAATGVGEDSRHLAARAFSSRLRLLLWAAAATGLIAAAAQIVLEGAAAAGVTVFSLTKPTLEATVETRFGTVWAFAFIAWLAIGALAPPVTSGSGDPRTNLPAVRERGGPLIRPLATLPITTLLIAAPLVYLCLCPALAGHASTQSPVALNFPVNAIHVAAMAIWLGGLAAMLLVLPAATRSVAAADRARLLAGPLARFSTLALAMVTLILATGLIQAYVYVRHPGDLFSTGYGRAVLAKFLLLLGVIGVAAYNRRASVPRLEAIAERGAPPGLPGVLLRRALRAEVALLAVVIGVTAALASSAPPISAASGPFSTSTAMGPTTLGLDVDPARVGANQIHLYFFDAKTGAPYRRGKELTLTATLPAKEIGPVPLTAQPAGPGHYIVADAQLNAPGEWEIALVLRVSEFDQLEKTVEVGVG
ncbi:MAG: copper resistance protein CopC/CopD [Actinobacteria bacterium]|nr:copper resistance protein CopC/CopD [Actinomycetota bacterium]